MLEYDLKIDFNNIINSMKKIPILLLASLFCLLCSCGGDEENYSRNLPVTYTNLQGGWDFRTIKLVDGQTIIYEGMCSSKLDFADFSQYGDVDVTIYYANCINASNEGANGYGLDDNRIFSAGQVFSNTLVTKLTADSLHVEYLEPTYMSFKYGPGDSWIRFLSTLNLLIAAN